MLEPDALDQTESDGIEFIAPSVLPDNISPSNGLYPLVTMAFGDAAVMTVLDFGPVDLDAQDHDWLGVQFGLLLENAPFLLRWAGQGGAAGSVDGSTP